MKIIFMSDIHLGSEKRGEVKKRRKLLRLLNKVRLEKIKVIILG